MVWVHSLDLRAAIIEHPPGLREPQKKKGGRECITHCCALGAGLLEPIYSKRVGGTYLHTPLCSISLASDANARWSDGKRLFDNAHFRRTNQTRYQYMKVVTVISDAADTPDLCSKSRCAHNFATPAEWSTLRSGS